MANFNLTGIETFAAATDEAQVSVLSNGLRVVTVKRPVFSVMVSVFANVGARNETIEENGISHFLEHMAFKGTNTRSAKDIVVEIERIGADINAMTGKATTAYLVNGLASHVGPALDILADVLTASTFDEEEIASEKEVVVQEIYESQDDIHDIAMDAFSATAYPDQPLGRPILGPEENVRSFTREMISDYMSRHYHPDTMLVIAVGDVSHAEFVTEVEARFGSLEPRAASEALPAQYVGGTTVIRDERFDQAQVIIGFPAPGSADLSAFATYDLLSDVLGGGMSAPLFQKVREERGLCYSIGSGVSAQADSSLFIIRGSTSNENVEEMISVACAELGRIANGEIEEVDWERARNQAVRQLVAQAEKTMMVTQRAATGIFTHGRVISMKEMVEAYLQLTREDLISAARKLIEVRPTVVIAGNGPELDYEALVKSSLIV